MQEVCVRLIGKKLLVALAMEGKFTSEGLQAIDGDDDMLTAMARELVENKGIGESSQSIWRNLAELQPPAARAVEVEPAAEVPPAMAVDVGGFDTPVTFEPIPVSTPADDAVRREVDGRRNTTATVLSIGKDVHCVQ